MRAKTIIVIALIACVVEIAFLLRPRPLPEPVVQSARVEVPPRTPPPPVEAPPAPQPTIEAPPLETPAAVQPDINPQSEPQTAVAEMLRLFKAAEFREFMAKFMQPSLLEQMPEERKAAALDRYKGFDEPGTPQNEQWKIMIQVLESVQDATPTINETGDRATFNVNFTLPDGTIPRGLPRTIVFQRENGLWYVR